ncbi:MAG: topoisomerase [Acetobacteraceae bacterium]|jgi:DNA topoisomerase-1|nr:topoisomerase [Acetobacteraceae bacterium]
MSGQRHGRERGFNCDPQLIVRAAVLDQAIRHLLRQPAIRARCRQPPNQTVERTYHLMSQAIAVSSDSSSSALSPDALKATAKAAKLRYVSDRSRGIRRERTGDGFEYFGANGTKITDEEELARIRKLAIPPAYQDVWICPFPNGHIQAAGRDALGRKRYRYHPRWRAVRDEGKYGKMLIFGKVLPAIRAQVERDLSKRGLPREKLLAAIVRLLEGTLIRVGNEEYAKTNNSFGLTALRNRHVKVDGSSRIRFDFRGKSGTEHHINPQDRKLAKIVRRCQELPGQSCSSIWMTTDSRIPSDQMM